MSLIPGQMAIQVVSGRLNKIPINAEILSFEPPQLKPKTVPVRGGRFVESSIVVGFEELSFTLKLSGIIDLMLSAFESGDPVEIYSSGVLENGIPIPIAHYMVVNHFSTETGAIEAGQLSETIISGTCKEYKYKEAGKTIHSVNVDTLECKHFGKDLTGKHIGSMALGVVDGLI